MLFAKYADKKNKKKSPKKVNLVTQKDEFNNICGLFKGAGATRQNLNACVILN